MDVALEKIWMTVTSLDQADNENTAMCYAIINLMIKQGMVTKEEATRQVEESVVKVVMLHKQIKKAMQEQRSEAGKKDGMTSLH